MGKSAALEAFQLGLLGELPGKAKCLEHIMRYTSRDEMSVHLCAMTARGDVDFTRRFLRDSENGERRPVRINGLQKKYEEGHRWIQERIGAVSISFDPHEFLNLTDSGKREWIVAHSPENFAMRKSGARFLVLARLAEKRLRPGCVLALLRSLGVDSLPALPSPQWERPEAEERLMALVREQDPKLFACLQKVVRSLFSLWPDSLSGVSCIDKLLAFLKLEAGRLRSIIREQGACVNVLRKDAFVDGLYSLDKQVEYKRNKVLGLARRIERLRAVHERLGVCDKMLGGWLQELGLIEEVPHENVFSRLTKELALVESAMGEEQSQLEALFRAQGKREFLRELEMRQGVLELELELVLHSGSLLGAEGVLGEMAAVSAAGLEKEVNDILRLVDDNYQFHFETSGKHFSMGWSRGGKFIPFNTINASHFILLMGPFLAALLRRLARSRAKLGLPTLRALCIEADAGAAEPCRFAERPGAYEEERFSR